MDAESIAIKIQHAMLSSILDLQRSAESGKERVSRG